MNTDSLFYKNLIRSGLSVDDINQLTPYFTEQDIAKGNVLLREGEVCSHTFFVDEGLLRCYTIGESGKEHIIQFAPEGWYVSDRGSVFFQKPAEFFIEAIEDSKVVVLQRAFYIKACERSTDFVAYNEVALHNHILHMQRRINLLLGAQAEVRYQEFVQLYPDMLLRVPQWMIASYLGITPESLSRVRKELAQRHQRK